MRSTMEDFAAFTQGERAVLEALNRHGVRFMLVGLSAAVLQGANQNRATGASRGRWALSPMTWSVSHERCAPRDP